MASVAPPPCLCRSCGTCSSSGRSNYFVYLWFYTAPRWLFHICCHCSSSCILPKIINVLVVRNGLKIGKGKVAAQLQGIEFFTSKMGNLEPWPCQALNL
ncbi:unnamed protein product [Miscanthus lutarioriparius]|uniref:Uncharacterized protein n=1 Tax=Miscanthus lutarioriparius TaxID=422564 RepID=A0A811RZ17_9POAL|nr:unnamed protein product [Miscanthus lutarioriparius]